MAENPFGDLIPQSNPFEDLIPEAAPAATGARAAAEDQRGPSYNPNASPSADWTESYPKGGGAPLADFADKVGQGFFMNYGDELAATAGALPNWLTGGRFGKSRADILREFREREKKFETEHPSAARVGEIGGALGSAVMPGVGTLGLLGRAPGVMRAAGVGALTAAPFGAIDATGRLEGDATLGDYGAAAGEGALVAGGIGGLLGGAGNVIGRTVGPWATEAAQRLTGRGVQLTPGETVGGLLARGENSAASFPLIGDMIRARANEGIESLNQEAYRSTLQPLGQRYIDYFRRQGNRAGNEAVEGVSDVLERRYNTVVPRMRAQVDPQLVADANRIAAALPADVQPQFRDAVRRYVDSVMDQNTMTITGDNLQQSLRSLRENAQRFQRSTADPWHADFGTALADLRTAIEGNMARHSRPRDVTAFNNINSAYARYVRIRDAASRVTSDEGVFSPAALHSSVRAADRSAGKGDTARGRALLQDLSGDARAVMKPKGAGSPTTERIALLGAITNPAIALKAAMYGVPAAALYTRAGSRAFQRAATFSPATRMALRRAIERAGNVMAPAAGALAEQEWNSP